jgi:UDP-4-amino-4,6-dideoxy-N-acetyl-beta-L-altrosamine transaminase
MAFIPYSCQYIDDTDVEAVVAALRSDFITQGPSIPVFEAAFAARHDVAHGIAVSNATAGLHIACLALGVRAGSLVWTSPNSFLASANCALYCGANVDFVDIDPVTRNMSLQKLEERLARAERTQSLPDLLIPVDFAGMSCDLREMRRFADRYGFRILEDASHATGASYLGKPTGSQWADATVFSFHAVKIVTTAEGGMITTHDAEIAKQLQALRSHGMTREAPELERVADGPWYYEQRCLGFNYRMTDLQAALGLSQLARLKEMHDRRIALADRYDALLKGLPLITPRRANDRVSAWHLYAVEVDDARTNVSRARLFSALRAAQIGVNVHYIPIHTQPYYARLGFKRGDFPNAERYYDRAISLPLFPTMTDVQQDRVADVIRRALAA